MNPQDQQKLERLVSNALRDLPARRAPLSLESRVNAEIARRAALPWWRKSFAYWPLPVRATFLVGTIGFVAVAFLAFHRATAAVNTTALKTAVASDLNWLIVARGLFETALHSANAIIGSVSPLWLYGGAAVIVGLYVTLFGLGAVAYRTLYVSR